MKISKITQKKYLSNPLFKVMILIITVLFTFIIWWFRRYFYRLENFGYVGTFLINVLANATIFLPIPTSLTIFVGGAIWNPFIVGIVGGIGSAIGEITGYLLGFGGSALTGEMFNKGSIWPRRVKKWFQVSGLLTVFITAALPDPFFDLVGITAGALHYPLWRFILATIGGRVLRNVLLAFLGAKIIS